MVYLTVDDLDFTLDDVPVLPRPGQVLFTTPEHFDVQYVINPHMAGQIGSVNQTEAAKQWEALREVYASIGISTEVIEGEKDLPDMVFCANQTLPYYRPNGGGRGIVPSLMHAEQRRDEVPYFEQFFRRHGYATEHLPPDFKGDFEGMGDAIWHPGRYLLWGGYGIRTTVDAYRHIAEQLDVRILALHLSDPDFYHLDTCFSPLTGQSLLLYPDAFQPEGVRLIEQFFDHLIVAPEGEARTLLACNAHCPDGTHVIIQRGCDVTNRRLRDAGFTPVEVDTDEFLKAGGSVFCMKQMFW